MEPVRRPNRADRKSTQARKAIGILIFLSIFVAGIAHLYLSAQSDTRPIDEATFCPKDSKGPHSITAVLIDRTDSFNPVQQAAIRDRLNELKDQTTKFDLLEIYAVEPIQNTLLRPEFAMCNPGRGDDTSKWTGNPQLVEERWQTLFATPLQHMFDSISDAKSAAISPIMESIQSISVTSLGSQSVVSKKIPRKLIIISDLLQYTKDYTQYHGLTTFNQFRPSPYYQNVRSDLSGISVEVWYVRRQSTLNLQGDKHISFWRDYLSDQGASVDKVWYVPGT